MSVLSDAIAAHQSGNLAEAERLYRIVLDQDPSNADACALLGTIAGARSELDEALALVDKAVSIDPGSGLFHFHRGTVLMAAKRLPESIEAFSRAVNICPDVPQIHFNMANALRAVDDWTAAIDHYRTALKLDPRFVVALNNLSLSLVHENLYDEALLHARRCVEINPNYGEGWLTLCNVAEKVKDYTLALSAGRKAAALCPNSSFAWFGLGLALNRLNQDAEAADAYKRALALEPDRVDTWDNLAQSLQSLNRLKEAEETYRKTVDVAGQTIPDESNREVDEDEYGDRHWHLALIELLQGNYRDGFARYRARGKAIAALKRKTWPCPLWRGEDLRGKKLLVCDEQGFGDTLMLARFLPLIKQQGAHIVFSVHKALKPLFEGWEVLDAVVCHKDAPSPCDYFCSSFDLPHRLDVRMETIPHDVPYLPRLKSTPETQISAQGLKVGVVWGGSPLHLSDKKRSIPLPLFADMFSIEGVSFFSFNRDFKDGDTETLPRYAVKDLSPMLTDFAASARLIDQMDLVITCDTATAHLAGGLGKKVWIMLPFAPDWRWLIGRDDSPWYPTARLFRQPRPEAWQDVVLEVKAALAHMAGQTRLDRQAL